MLLLNINKKKIEKIQITTITTTTKNEEEEEYCVNLIRNTN